jgi:protein-disulfide isomerase
MRILIALLALATIGAAPVDWTKTVTRGANGAYIMGNPKAKVRLVEYLSYSCPHCAHFTTESAAPLKANYVSKGTVAVEMRNAVRDRFDFASALLARCGGPIKFYAHNEAIFAAQDALMAKASAHEAGSNLPEGSPINMVLGDMARGSGLIDFMATRGVPAATANACIANKAEQDIVLGMTKEAWQVRKLQGTPMFLINGVNAGFNDWASLERKIRAALQRK